MLDTSEHTDVVVIGGGPIGLLTAYALQRMGIDTVVVERLDKSNMPMYGRACTLYARTLEMLDQVEILDGFLQIGVQGRNNVNFDHYGQRVNTRGWQAIFGCRYGTFFDYFLNIRLKYSEELIQSAYEQIGGRVLVGWELDDLTLGSGSVQEYKTTATIKKVGSTVSKAIRGKYVLGADGGASKVRRLTEIPFKVDQTTYRWVRIDGVIKTNVPDERLGVSSFESPTHGNILWVPIDHGRTRIGFALNAELYQKYGDAMTEEQAKEEAIASVRPFKLEFECVDWYTLYHIRQGVAESYFHKDAVFLAGDACHTHSSGAAQGMNTGVHDAINLSWKLAGVLRGWYQPEVLHTYQQERRPIAQSLIEQDRKYSKLITGMRNSSSDNADELNTLLTEHMANTAAFVVGVGIKYQENLLNLPPTTTSLIAGQRPDDFEVYPPGRSTPVRIQQLTPNTGSFWVIVCTGVLEYTRSRLRTLRDHIDSSNSFAKKACQDSIKFLTVIDGQKADGAQDLGMKSFGRFYFDPFGHSLARYGLSEQEGGVIVLRPDGYLGFATALDRGHELDEYFTRFVSTK